MKTRFILIYALLLSFIFISCNKKEEVSNIKTVNNNAENQQVEMIEEPSPEEIAQKKYEEAISLFVKEMSLEEKIGQMFLITIGGTTFSDSYYDLESFIAPGGYLLFAYNFENGKQTIDFTSSIQNWYSKNSFINPFFSVDQEGGLVNRLRNVASPLPSAKSVGKFLSLDLAQQLYDLSAKQISALGIQVNLGPVVEILTEDNEGFLDSRSFGDFEKVIPYSEIFINSMLENNVFPVVKHFPGNNADDPHLGLPIINYDIEKTKNILISPFEKIENKENLGILVAHSVLPSLFNSETPIPACLSKEIVTNLLKNQLGYSGLVFSDDLLMAALQNNGYDSITAITMAIKAGINVLMISQKEYLPFIKEIAILSENDQELVSNIEESVSKIIDYKIKYGILNYEDGKISIPNAKTAEELQVYQNIKYEEFSKVKEEGEEFYRTYWG